MGAYSYEVLSYTVKKHTNVSLIILQKKHVHVTERANYIHVCNLCSKILNNLVCISVLIGSSVRGAKS